MYGIGGYGASPTGQWSGRQEPSATLGGASIASPRSIEGKAAKVFIDKTNVLVFDETIFAEMILAIGGQGMQPRVMEIVKALIRNLAREYDNGVINAATVEARRLMDTMENYNM